MLLYDTNVLLKRLVYDLGTWETELIILLDKCSRWMSPSPIFDFFFLFWWHMDECYHKFTLSLSPEKQCFLKKSINNTFILKFISNVRILPQRSLKTTIKQTTADRVKFLERKAPSPAINALIFALNCLRFRFPFASLFLTSVDVFFW